MPTRRKPRPKPNPPFPAVAWALASRQDGHLGERLYDTRDAAMAMLNDIKGWTTFDTVVEMRVAKGSK